MIESDTIVTSSKRRPRWIWGSALIVAPVLLLGFAWWGYKWRLEREYRAAIEEADRLDPGWRLADLEAARAEIPDAENAALQILAAGRLMPAGWNPPSPGTISTKLEDELDHLLPIKPLDESQLKELHAELGKASLALPTARKVAAMPRGRYVILWSPDAIMTPLLHVDQAHPVTRLLRLDAIRWAEEGNIDEALVSCRALLNIGRSFGDESTLVPLWRRTLFLKPAVRSLERALAQGLASESALAEIQRLLAEEADQPLLLIVVRAERAMVHQFLDFVEAGGSSSIGLVSRTGSREMDEFLDRGKARGCHAAYLRYLNQCVEIAKLPPEQQVERLRHFDLRPPDNVPRLLAATAGSVGFKQLAGSFHAGTAFLRCAIVAIAVERYRLANGHWPNHLDELVPRYLNSVPTDPFDGQPLRYRRTKDGVIIYTVGEDQKDDGGQRVRVQAGRPDTDVGFQLWDPERRGQTAGKH